MRGPGGRPAGRDPRSASSARERVLVTTLTKRMAEDLTQYYQELGVRCATCTRTSTRSSASRSCATCGAATFDVLVGINLLREGLDLPEVSLVADPRRRQGGLPALGGLAHPDRRAAPRATSTAGSSCTPTRSPTRCARRSTRPSGGARCRRPTTTSTASRRRPIVKDIDERAVERLRARLRDGARRVDERRVVRTQAELDAHSPALEQRDEARRPPTSTSRRAAALRDRISGC